MAIASLADLTPTARKLLSPIEPFSATKVIAALGDYADNDVVSDSASVGTAWEFTSVIRSAPGGTGKLVGGNISFSRDSLLATSRLHLFTQAPTASMLNDNVAFSLGAADRPFYLGYIDFVALVDVGAFSFALSTGLTIAGPLLVYSVGTSLWGILQITDAETNELAGMSCTITLFVD